MNALVFIVQTLLSLVLFVFMLRVLPPIGKIDTASLVAVILVATVEVVIVAVMSRLFVPDLLTWVRLVAMEIVRTALSAYFYAILLYAVLSMIAPGGYSPVQSLLGALCEPILRPIRRVIPPIAALDFSPLWALIAIQAALILLR
jgi:YggT family protein